MRRRGSSIRWRPIAASPRSIPIADQSLDFLSSHPNAPQRVDLARRHARAFGAEGADRRSRPRLLSSPASMACSTATARRKAMSAARPSCTASSASVSTCPPASRSTTRRKRCLRPVRARSRSASTASPTRSAGSLTDYIASGWVTGLQAGDDPCRSASTASRPRRRAHRPSAGISTSPSSASTRRSIAS